MNDSPQIVTRVLRFLSSTMFLVLLAGFPPGCSDDGAATDATDAPRDGDARDEGGGADADADADGDDAAAGDAEDGDAVVPVPGLIDPERITAWNPGILHDDQLDLPLGPDGLPQRTDVCATLDPGQDIQAAIDGCAEGRVVELRAGTFTVSSTITLERGVVLRGAGSQGAPTGTTIVKTGGESVLAIGTERDSICYGGDGIALAADAPKEATTISVGGAAGDFTAGDLALIDEVDDAAVQEGDCGYFKRVSGRSASQRVRIESVDGAAGTLALGSPLHWRFTAAAPYRAEVVRVTAPVVEWAGIERLRIQGGTNPGYNGQMAGGIDVSNAAFCWVKDVQTDETIGGMHVSLTATYRCVVRDSYFHHSADYGFGRDCYGIVLRCGAADNLVENNIVRYMNKPILFNVTGGGNVVGYNYADNSWATPPAWQEVNIDCHCSFPHMELIEGNFAPHMGATTTHGNAGYLTFFRNYSSSVFAPPAVWGSTEPQTGNITVLQLQGGDIGMNAVGNVFGTAGVTSVYQVVSSSECARSTATNGPGRKSTSGADTPTGPAPGPPPPCGVLNVLCRLKCSTSKPRSPGRTMPSSALRLAPSPYISPPYRCTSAATCSTCSSNRPSVLGLVSIMPARCAPCSWQADSSAARSTFPRASEGISTTRSPTMAEVAGLVPCAESGTKTTLRALSPRSRW